MSKTYLTIDHLNNKNSNNTERKRVLKKKQILHVIVYNNIIK